MNKKSKNNDTAEHFIKPELAGAGAVITAAAFGLSLEMILLAGMAGVILGLIAKRLN